MVQLKWGFKGVWGVLGIKGVQGGVWYNRGEKDGYGQGRLYRQAPFFTGRL